MILIVGLGNPGRDYTGTRHNIGFEIIDSIADSLDSGNSYTKFNSTAFNVAYAGFDLLLLKPQTFMNNSGSAVTAVLKAFPEDIDRMVVIHDDIDIEFGRLKIKSGGNTAGHKGLQSIFEKTGSLDFDRLRFGVGRPPGRMEASDYVLRLFKKGEAAELGFLVGQAVEMVKDYIENGLEHTANKYN